MCLGQSAPDPRTFCISWINRLDDIHAAIPSFATWRIDELVELFAQYRTILTQVENHQVLYRKCETLVKNLGLIEGAIEKACRDRNWLPFNRAALEMGWDIEILRDVLRIYASN
jgi:hypothetical protein